MGETAVGCKQLRCRGLLGAEQPTATSRALPQARQMRTGCIIMRMHPRLGEVG